MNYQEIERKVVGIVTEYAGEPINDLHKDLTDHGLDSLDRLEMVMEIEEAFDIEIPDEKIEEFTGTQSVIDCVVGVLS